MPTPSNEVAAQSAGKGGRDHGACLQGHHGVSRGGSSRQRPRTSPKGAEAAFFCARPREKPPAIHLL